MAFDDHWLLASPHHAATILSCTYSILHIMQLIYAIRIYICDIYRCCVHLLSRAEKIILS